MRANEIALHRHGCVPTTCPLPSCRGRQQCRESAGRALGERRNSEKALGCSAHRRRLASLGWIVMKTWSWQSFP
eukprot:5701783-Prorocentrum_lima.AAC.1